MSSFLESLKTFMRKSPLKPAARAVTMLTGAVLGVDVMTDVAVDEKKDWATLNAPAVSSSAVAGEQRSPDSPSLSENHTVSKSDDTCDTCSVGTAVKGMTSALMLLLGSLSIVGPHGGKPPGEPIPNTGPPLVRVENFPVQRGEWAIELPVPAWVFELSERASGAEPDELAKALHANSSELCELLNRRLEAVGAGSFVRVADIKVTLAGGRLVIAITGRLSGTGDLFAQIQSFLPGAVRDQAVQLFTEKMNAFLEEHTRASSSHDVLEIGAIVKRVVDRQIRSGP